MLLRVNTAPLKLLLYFWILFLGFKKNVGIWIFVSFKDWRCCRFSRLRVVSLFLKRRCRETSLPCLAPSVTRVLTCITGPLWANHGEHSILRKPRNEERRKTILPPSRASHKINVAFATLGSESACYAGYARSHLRLSQISLDVRVGFLRRFVTNTGINFVWNRVLFSRELRECMNVCNSKLITNKFKCTISKWI